MGDELDEIHRENALKLGQILDLEQLLYDTRILDLQDGSPCWCGFFNHVHEPTCLKAREATAPLWR